MLSSVFIARLAGPQSQNSWCAGPAPSAPERDEWLRTAWRVTLAGTMYPRKLVSVDEMGTNTSLSLRYAYAPKGRRAYAKVPRNRGANTTLLASMSLEGVGPCLAVKGATTTTVFEAYIEKVLAPSLRRGQIMVLDNLGAHKSERVRELIEGRDCQLLSSCPRTHRASIPLRKLSQRSRGPCEKQGLVPAQP
jgi:hypothetical protein